MVRWPIHRIVITLSLIGGSTAMADTETTDRANKFVAAHEAKFKSLDRKASVAWWDANITGKDEDFARKEETQNVIDAALADAKAFAELKGLHEAGKIGAIDDKIVARCIDVLYLGYLEKQVDTDL